MPATDAALESARAAADAYADAVAAERRLLTVLPAPGHPDRPVIEASLADVGRIARRTYDRYRHLALDLLASGHVQDQALALIRSVNERTTAARPPVEVTVSEDDR